MSDDDTTEVDASAAFKDLFVTPPSGGLAGIYECMKATDCDVDDEGSALILAAKNGDLEYARVLIDHALCDVNDIDKRGWTALMHAATKIVNSSDVYAAMPLVFSYQ